MLKRRFFLLAAPAIVAAPSLMRVSAACLDLLRPLDWYDEFYRNLRANPPPLTLKQQLAMEVQRRTIANADKPLGFVDGYAFTAEWVLDNDGPPLLLQGAVKTTFAP
jgi:hypothetical protein